MQNNSSSSPSICCPAGKNTPEQISKQKPNRKPTLKLQKYWTILSQVWLKSSILNTHRMCLPLDDLVLSATHGKAPPPSAFLQGMAFLGFQTFELSWNTSVRCCQDRTTGLTMIDISLEGIKTCQVRRLRQRLRDCQLEPWEGPRLPSTGTGGGKKSLQAATSPGSDYHSKPWETEGTDWIVQ